MVRGLFQHAPRSASAAAIPGQARPGAEENSLVPVRAGLTRRAFLVRSSLAAGVAAVVGSVPGVGNILTTAEADSPEVEGGAGAMASTGVEMGPGVSQPIVAHVVDLSTGEINLYQGTAQVVTRNPGLARAIARLAAARN